MTRVRILAVGRVKDRAWRAACDDYYKRCRRRFSVEERELRTSAALEGALPKKRDAVVIALDEQGDLLTSREFAGLLRRAVEGPSRSVDFLIGGADGLTAPMRERADHVLSFGRMTFAHRIVRVLLAEQLYRGVSIIDGSPYHREG